MHVCMWFYGSDACVNEKIWKDNVLIWGENITSLTCGEDMISLSCGFAFCEVKLLRHTICVSNGYITSNYHGKVFSPTAK